MIRLLYRTLNVVYNYHATFSIRFKRCDAFYIEIYVPITNGNIIKHFTNPRSNHLNDYNLKKTLCFKNI